MTAIILAVTWYWTRRDRPGFVTFLVFYLILFVGSHLKGLTALAVPILIGALMASISNWKKVDPHSHL